MDPIKEALTFDDVTLAPNYSAILPTQVQTKINLSKYLVLKIPLLSSAMDTVTESKMAISLAKQGGIGVIHRNMSINKQLLEIKKVKSKGLLVGAMNKGTADRYFQKIQKDVSKYVPEGVEGLVKFKGNVDNIIYKLIGGLKSSMGYLGAKKIINLRKKPKFVKITKAGFYESMVHNIDEVKKERN